MTTDRPLPTPDARPPRTVLSCCSASASPTAAATDSFVPEPCEIDANPALIEQAKGALMLHFGVDSHQAFALLVRWARTSRTPVPTIAHTLMRGICEGNPQTEVRHRPLMRWLEAQLRNGDPDHAQLRSATSRREPAHESPRPD